MTTERIGIVSPDWPPRYGGAAIYAYRLARALAARGKVVHVAVGTPPSNRRPNGTLEVDRPARPISPEDTEDCLAWYDHLGRWMTGHKLTHILINAPLSRPDHGHARTLYQLATRAGCVVGAIHYDLGRDVASELSWTFGLTGSWEKAANRATAKVLAHFERVGDDQGYRDIGSPCSFAPNFVISCSSWSDRFIDPHARHRRVVLHPFLDVVPEESPAKAGHLATEPAPMDHVDVSFINPLPHKGSLILADLVCHAPRDRSFRVLKGGYGDGLASFRTSILNSSAYQAGRVQLLEYCEDMNIFYERTGLLLFPSLYEGYGMAAVEPMLHGIPVVATAYPSILEGVGDGACTVPFTASMDDWNEAVDFVLRDRKTWSQRARERASLLLLRQEEELQDFVGFLESL